jgi:hypothetical protein
MPPAIEAIAIIRIRSGLSAFMKPLATHADIATLCRFVRTAQIAYNQANKETFLRETRRLAARMARDLELESGAFDIRVNPAGIGSSGDVTLHAEHLYVCFGAEIDFGRGRTFCFRGCRSRRDYTGLGNQWALWDDLAHRYAQVIGAMRAAENGNSAVICPWPI